MRPQLLKYAPQPPCPAKDCLSPQPRTQPASQLDKIEVADNHQGQHVQGHGGLARQPQAVMVPEY